MALADKSLMIKRFNRLLFNTDTFTDALSNPPKRRIFNSDTEIETLALESDEILCWNVRNCIGHEWAPTFFTLSSALVNGDKIPASDAPVHKFTWSATSNGTYTDSEEADKSDIINVVRDYTVYGDAVTDTYGFHHVEAMELITTSPFVKVTQAPWTRTTALQSPQTFSVGILCGMVANCPKEGLNTTLIEYCNKKFTEFCAAVKNGAMIIPEVEALNVGGALSGS